MKKSNPRPAAKEHPEGFFLQFIETIGVQLP
jgi:hypothetical protein